MNHRILLVFSATIFFLFSCGITDDYKQISHQEFLKSHQYNIGQTTLNLKDDRRQRPIKIEIWYPTKDTKGVNITTEYPFKLPPTSKDADIISDKFPLILLSHGTGGNRISQMWLACELVGNGFIVAAVDHYGNTLDNKIPENFVKVWDRPLDISFLLDTLLNHPKFNAVINTSKIGMAGFSLGGYTAIVLAGGELDYSLLKEFSNTEEGRNEFDLPELGNITDLITPQLIKRGNTNYTNLKDDRISAFVAMAPAIGQGFKGKEQFVNVHNPILIIGAEIDNRASVITNAKHYANLIESSKYVELKGEVGHYIFMNEAKSGLKRNAPLIFEDNQSINRKQIHNKVSQYILDFFNAQFNEKNS